MSRAKKWVWLTIILIVLVVFKGIGTIADAVWQSYIHYESVFLNILATDIVIFVVAFAVLFVATFYVLRRLGTYYQQSVMRDIVAVPNVSLQRLIKLGAGAISVFVALLGASVMSDIGWSEWLLFLHHVPFGKVDPIFHIDMSFYVFDLPVYETIVYTAEVVLILYAIASTLIYGALTYGTDAARHIDRGMERMWRFTCLLWGLWVAAFSFSYVLKRYDLLYNTNGVVVGVGYTQAHVTLPYYTIAAVVCFLFAILLFMRAGGVHVAEPLSKLTKHSATGAVLIRLAIPIAVIVMMVIGSIWESVVQHVIVAGNETVYERPYLQMNITATRNAFGLDSQHLSTSGYDMTQPLTASDVQVNQAIIKNARINDPRNLGPVYNQLQSFKVFNEFLDIDVDRYNGREMFLSARELNQDRLPAQAQTWVNKTLVYTHGYGVVASPVNEVNTAGEPILAEKDMPETGSLPITRPEIYFGEEDSSPVIAGSGVPEFDYPSGDGDVTSHYHGAAGVPMTTMNRLLFAWNEGSIKMLTSPQVNAQSKLLLHRNLYDRIQSVAPFLTLDHDAYIVVRDNGHLDWIVDAYTTTDHYPFSEQTTLGDQPNSPVVNYVRNSIKVVVDAYTGSVTLYQVDRSDPIANSWAKVFPGIMHTVVPADLQRHFRYPEQLFKTQSQMLLAYHMTDPTSFYNRDDLWSLPNEEINGKTQPMNPNYIMMQLPGQQGIEFVLAQPFTPANKNNLVSWLVARNDGSHYGELKLYTFPRGRLLYGPMQTENLIDQTPSISQQLTLWNQSGSRVIRGNLLALPMGQSVLYVEPLYLESERQGSLPEVKRVIVANQDRIVMANTLEDALNEMFNGNGGTATGSDGSAASGTGTNGVGATGPGTAAGVANSGQGGAAGGVGGQGETLAQQAADAIAAYKAATANGDYVSAGKDLDQLQKIIEALNSPTKAK